MKNTLFDGERAYAHVQHLAETIGSRHAGSAGEHAAAEYIADALQEYGYTVSFQEFPIASFLCDTASCAYLLNDTWHEVPSLAVLPTLPTPPEGIEGEIFFAENGSRPYLTPAMRDKIVVLYGTLAAADRPRVVAYGAKAVVCIEECDADVPKKWATTPAILSRWGDVPCVRIRYRDGHALIHSGTTRMRVRSDAAWKKSVSRNVIAEKKGTTFPEEICVVCGHYDSHFAIPGAVDNAGGTAAVLELARIFAQQSSQRTLRFVAFAAEESGLHGSFHYARELQKAHEAASAEKNYYKGRDVTECERHRLVFNLDVLGLALGYNTVLFSGVEDIGASVRLLAHERGIAMKVIDQPMSSDGTPLAAVGIPALQIARYGVGNVYGHSVRDDMSHMSADALAITGAFSAQWLERYVLHAASFPFERTIPEKHLTDIDAYFSERKRPNPRLTDAEDVPSTS